MNTSIYARPEVAIKLIVLFSIFSILCIPHLAMRLIGWGVTVLTNIHPVTGGKLRSEAGAIQPAYSDSSLSGCG